MAYIKATVTAVDLNGGVCKCKRDNDGMPLMNIPWANAVGTQGRPNVGERVLIWKEGGDLIITHVFPGPASLSAASGTRPSITDGVFQAPSVSTSSVSKTTFTSDAATDTLPGDKTMTSRGGAVIAALLSGGVLLKAGPMVQIFMSRVDDLLRLFCRNLEQFSDARSTIEVSLPDGRLYTYQGSYKDLYKSRDGIISHDVITGDVAAGEALGLGYTFSNATPPVDGRVRLERVLGASGEVPFSSVLSEDGEEVDKAESGDNTVTKTQNPTEWEIEYNDGTNTNSIKITNTIVIKANGSQEASITLTPAGILSIVGQVLNVDVPTTNFNGIVNISQALNVLGLATLGGMAVLGTGPGVTGPATIASTLQMIGAADIQFATSGYSFLTHKHGYTSPSGPAFTSMPSV